MKNRRLPILLLLVLLSFSARGLAQRPPAPPLASPAMQTGGEIAAQSAATVWLALLDDGQFAQSWDAAAGLVHKAVAKDQWVKVMTDNRPKLGKMLSRNVKSSRFTSTIPNAPTGQYVAIEFTTSFEHRKTATETLTTTLDADGQWKVAGYFFK